jgi:hypothetical protein
MNFLHVIPNYVVFKRPFAFPRINGLGNTIVDKDGCLASATNNRVSHHNSIDKNLASAFFGTKIAAIKL